MADYRAQFRGTPSSVREARQAILDYARLCGFDNQQTYEIALGAGEALANAVEHGSRNLGFIDIACTFADGELIVEITDSGSGFDFAKLQARKRDPDAIRGFGISIMRAVMDRVEYVARGETIRLHKKRAATVAVDAERASEEA